MRRASITAAAIMLMLVAFAPAALAQDQEHPMVGSWVKDPAPDDPANQNDLTVFNADGTILDFAQPQPGVGSWESTEDGGFAATSVYPLVDPEAGFLGYITARLVGQVSEDGQTMSGTYTIEFPSEPAGMFPPGEYGPADWTASRVAVEPQGEPAGPWPLPVAE